MPLTVLAYHIARALYLLGFCIAPGTLSPDPVLAAPEGIGAFSAIVGFGILAGMLRFARYCDTTIARVAAALTWVAVAASLAGSLVHDGDRGPLGRAVYWVAPLVWAALATTAAAAAGEWLGSNWKHKRTAAAVLVLGVSAKLFGDASSTLQSSARMWHDALRRDPAHERALSHVAAPLLTKHKHAEARRLADRCLAVRPESCACLEVRATAALQGRAAAAAATDARAALQRCPERAALYVVLAEALALTGDVDGADKAATAGIELGGDVGRLRYARALANERAGRLAEAAAEAEAAIAAGAGRDAKLLAAAVAIARNDLDAALKLLDPLVAADPNDVEALYDRALVSDRKGDFNGARQRYLAALKLDPKHADARYNLALLTHRAGVVDEARHHAAKFAEAQPDDPRRRALAAAVGLAHP